MYKKITLAALMAVVSLSVSAEEGGFKAGETPQPQHKQDAGYKGSEDTGQGTVKASRDMRKDAWVTLEGYIIKDHGNNRYDFRDQTGTMVIMAPKKVFDGKEYTAKDKIRVSGYVKGKGPGTTLNAERIEEP